MRASDDRRFGHLLRILGLAFGLTIGLTAGLTVGLTVGLTTVLMTGAATVLGRGFESRPNVRPAVPLEGIRAAARAGPVEAGG